MGIRVLVRAAALATLTAGLAASGASADSYFYRSKPVVIIGGIGNPEEPAPIPTLSLDAAALPEAMVGETWSYNFASILRKENLPSGDEVSWSAPGAPAWLKFAETSGHASGTPTAEATTEFEVVASHGGVEARRSYTVVVGGVTLRVTQISVGDYHTCAVTVAGAAKCWGHNGQGRLGNGTTVDSVTPVAVSGLASGVASIDAGGNHTCATTTAGRVMCWGLNSFGQLGDGTVVSSSVPVAVTDLGTAAALVSAGDLHTCALTTAGGVECWGYNDQGRLGNSTTMDSPVPVQVKDLGNGVASISAGKDHTCAVMETGRAACWGKNGEGRLGDGTTTSSSIPVTVSGLSVGAASISAGASHTCAVTTDGAARCWGTGDGRLGNGSKASKVPVAVSGLGTGVVSVSAGGYHSCATTSDSVLCWGSGSNGKLGRGSLANSNTPVVVTGLGVDLGSVAAGLHHTCVASKGSVNCWGYNNLGQLGDGTTTDRRTPTEVLPKA